MASSPELAQPAISPAAIRTGSGTAVSDGDAVGSEEGAAAGEGVWVVVALAVGDGLGVVAVALGVVGATVAPSAVPAGIRLEPLTEQPASNSDRVSIHAGASPANVRRRFMRAAGGVHAI